MVEAGREGGVHVHVHVCAPGLLQGWWETISWCFSASYMRNESVRWVVGFLLGDVRNRLVHTVRISICRRGQRGVLLPLRSLTPEDVLIGGGAGCRAYCGGIGCVPAWTYSVCVWWRVVALDWSNVMV